MHVVKLLHDLFDNACVSVDKRICKTLFSAVEALTRCKQLSITSLGRSLNRPIPVKHTIKCMDRLFGNSSLHQKRIMIYKALAHRLLQHNNRPVIIVDWSGLTPCGAFHFLSASVAIDGRSLTLYSEAFPLKKYASLTTHLSFLKILKQVLPRHCKPIIITDAGFRNNWFSAVLALGWDFIGRVRHKTLYSRQHQNQWLPIKSLYKYSSEKACFIGRVVLSRSTQLECYFYLMKQKKKNRKKKNLAGKKIQCSVSKKHAKGGKEPWLMASSLSNADMSASDIMKLYKKRMQIEEVFRDLKNTHNGLGLRHCRSFKVERLTVALLIGALAMLVLWIAGICAKHQELHYSFQSNTIKSRNVLSVLMIGWQVMTRKAVKFRKKECQIAVNYMASITVSGEHYAK